MTIYDLNDEKDYIYIVSNQLRYKCRSTRSYLSREAYRDKVEAYSQLLKQQRLKATASTEARKIAQTGFLPKIDITAEGTANLNHLDAWNSPAGQYRPYTYQALATLGQPLYTGGSLMARKKLPKPMKSWTNLPQS